MSHPPLSPENRKTLLDIAAASVAHGLEHEKPLEIQLSKYPPELGEQRATFVTLNLHDELQGCIGTLKPRNPLAEDVAQNAYSAAFEDPRGILLTRADLPDIHIHISLLLPAEPVEVKSEEELASKLRAGVDGLIIQEFDRRGTFLPSVWESLPDPRDFIRHLKLKAGLPMSYWSPTLKFSRYGTESFSN